MASKVALFWPGDYRATPNKLALPNAEAATAQLEKALKKLGRQPYRVKGFLTRPHEAIEKLGPIDDPLIGVCVHWFYGPHTTDGVVGKDNPLLLCSNFSGEWPGLVGLLNTAGCLESVGRKTSRAWTGARDWTKDRKFMARLEEWCNTGRIQYPEDELHYSAPVSPAANQLARKVRDGIRRRRILALMLGDTSMGMINGYFGHRLLNTVGFTEHKVDQAWLIHRGKRIKQARIDDAYKFVVEKGVKFHYGIEGADDFDERATKEQLRDYLTILDLVKEFKTDCIGIQYQLGLLDLRPPTDFAEGLLNSACRPETNGLPIACSTEADQGNLIPMELMKRLLLEKGLHPATIFHDVRWGATHKGKFYWVLENSGSISSYAFNSNPDSLKGVNSYRQPKMYFPVPGGTFTGEGRPGEITWSRAYLKDGALWMDVGRGKVAKLPPKVRDKWWSGTTREWPFMATDMYCSRDAIMAHYQSNHVAVAYGDVFEEMVSLSQQLGFKVRVISNRL